MPTSDLSPDARRRALAGIDVTTYDVLVIGGGVTGAGAALDAASRGLSVALLEKRDFAAGTSSRSSKLLHGGLRYLEQADFALVREALQERSLILTRLAPHLARPVPFLYPLKHRTWERAYVGAGVALYDALGGRRPAVPRHRHLSKTAALRLAPSLAEDSLTGAVRYFDAQVDDARFVVTLLRTAASLGAVCLSGVTVTSFLEEDGRVCGVHAHDAETGSEHTVRARVVINATGVWTTGMERLAGVAEPILVKASKGVHLLVPRERIESEVAWILRTDKSVLFVIPWSSHWVIGTTDTSWSHDRDHPAASAADVRYLLDHVNRQLRPSEALTEADVVGVYAGLRPLVSRPESDSTDTTRISREHVVRLGKPGFVSVAGGKYTTYRVMAEDAVDLAAEQLGVPVDASRTRDLPLLGARGLPTARARVHEHPAASIIGPGATQRLLRRYGSVVFELLDAVTRTPSLAQPFPGSEDYLLVEAHHATAAEGALHLEDVLTRRTRVSIETRDRGAAAAPVAARVMGNVLGWKDSTVTTEVKRYLARLEAESNALAMPDDESADVSRSAVKDPRLVA
ncbi:glycerol-3-phosphate dehydrogenase/oxidase [Streptomyces sp. NPDC014864]|uniref:glycerol-3-phosphate dehydrogenase/oxidase n=1 Tax=Streptomyces sp. NPDC014864 TaxID=3364924 RepID=UPI0036FFACBA